MDMADPTLKIGYAGSLKAHRPGEERQAWWRPIADLFWTYRNRSLQHHTRSGYFLLKGVEAFHKAYPDLVGSLKVELWGMIDKENERQVEAFGIGESVEIAGYFPKDESAAKLAACDLLFLPLETADDPLFIPGKVFDYIRLGKPVLVLGPESDCTRILDKAGLGIRLDPLDSESIAEKLHELIGLKARLPELYRVDQEWVESQFHFKNLSRQLHDIFEAVQD